VQYYVSEKLDPTEVEVLMARQDLMDPLELLDRLDLVDRLDQQGFKG